MTGHFCVTENTTRDAHHIVLFAHPSSIYGPLPPSKGNPTPGKAATRCSAVALVPI